METATVLLCRVKRVYRDHSADVTQASANKYIPHASLDVLKAISGGVPGGVQSGNLACVFAGGPPPTLRRGWFIQATGQIHNITAKKRQFVVREYVVQSSSAIRTLIDRKGIDAQAEREHLAADGMFSIAEAVEKGKAGAELVDLYTQDVARLHYLLTKAGMSYDLEMAYHIRDFLSRRAYARKYEAVADMVEANPYVLADVEQFRWDDLKKMVNNLGSKVTPETTTYAEMSGRLWREARQGHSFVPLGVLSAALGGSLSRLGIPANKRRQFIASLGKMSPEDMPHNNMSRVCVSGTKDLEEYNEEIRRYYREQYTAAGSDKADFWANVAVSGVYLARAFFAEADAAKWVAERCTVEPMKEELAAVPSLECLSDEQRQAIVNALTYKVSAITGGAGTGKTYTVQKLVELIQRFGHDAMVLAPSAMAAVVAARKVDGSIPYRTIHRFARILPEDSDYGEFAPKYEKKEEITQTFLIVDEMSMCDITTFAALLHTVGDSRGVRIVLIGDEAQLPTIGPSGFFHQIAAGLLAGHNLPVTRLTFNYRSSGGVAEFAAAVREGTLPESVTPVRQVPLNAEEVASLATQLKTEGYGLDDILFLASNVKGEYGTDRLNALLRPIFLAPGAPKIENTKFFVGDQVVSIKNDYHERTGAANRQTFAGRNRHPGRAIDVYNGSRGVIEAHDNETGTVTVRYTTPEGVFSVPYTVVELPTWIDVAYSLTVHKAQGSEAEVVVFVRADATRKVTRNMLYTACSRAREKVFLVGDGWDEAVKRVIPAPFSKFSFRVKKLLRKAPPLIYSVYGDDEEVW